MSKGRVLVTGSPGWLGTRFVEILVENGRDVRCLVLPDADASELEKPGVEIHRGDVTDLNSLKGICNGIDTVFHLAGIIHPKRVREFYDVNTLGTKNMLKVAADADVKRFIYMSSNSAQGNNISREKLMTEEGPDRPYMSYGKSKFLAEQAVKEYQKTKKIETTILRACWYYGLRQPERQTRLMKMVLKGRALKFGDGMNLRGLSYIDDVSQALLLAEKTPEANGQTYWIADERPYTMMEIYGAIADELGVPLKTLWIPGIACEFAGIADWILQKFGIYVSEIHVAGEMNKNIACSIEKAKKELGYKPKIDLREGMKRSIKWAKEQGIL